MDNMLPSQNLSLLRTLLGKKIVSIKRQLFKGDMDLADYEQNADGPVEFIMNDNSVLHFIANAERFSISMASGEMPRYGDSYELTDVSNNPFWSTRVRQEISQLTILKTSDWSEDYPNEFGIEILFENGEKVLIEYLDEENYPDMIKVADHYAGKPCITQLVE